MMNFSEVLKNVQSAFRPRKSIDFDEFGIHIEIEPLSSIEEVKVLESLKDVEGAQYMEGLRRNTLSYAIKKINDIDLDGDIVRYKDETGKELTKSKFLFMIDFIGQWPSTLVDVVFDAFSNLLIEVESKVRTGMKFERFQLTEKPEEKSTGLKKVTEKEEPEDENARLQKKVDEEIAQADSAVARAESEAMSKL